MGLDFANFQIFCGDQDHDEFRRYLLDGLPGLLAQDGYVSATVSPKPDRAIVVGSPDRWLVIYDSDTLDFTPKAEATVGKLGPGLSRFGVVVQVDVDDSAWLELTLYRDGHRIDHFVNYPDQYVYWLKQRHPLTAAAESDFYGQPEKWRDLLLRAADLAGLRATWYPGVSCSEALRKTAAFFGWHPVFCQRGYEVASDGIPAFFYNSPWMGAEGLDFSEFRTLYFAKADV
jgi:hypothetical protein